MQDYQLDPAHYYTSPGLSFDACLKMTQAKIELLTEPDHLLFFESAIRAGVSMITHRYACANNPTFHPRELQKKFGSKQNPEIEKLVPNFMPKHRYVRHYRNFNFYMEKGLILGKIHRLMSFTQNPWIKPYVDFNTTMRQNAKSASDKNFFKFLSNALFGKTMQNLRSQTDIKLTTSGATARNYVAKPNFDSFTRVNETLVAIKMKPVHILWDKPTYTGACILDLSKLHLFRFHYDIMKAKYDSRAKLLFTDTDSLCYHITTDDVYD